MAKQRKNKDERDADNAKRYKFFRNLCVVVCLLTILIFGLVSFWTKYHQDVDTKVKIANARLNEVGLTDGLATQESVTEELISKLAPDKPLLQETRKLIGLFEQAARDEYWLDESFTVNSSILTGLNQYKLVSVVYTDMPSVSCVARLMELAVATANSNRTAGWDIIELQINGDIFIQLPSRADVGLSYIPIKVETGLLPESIEPLFELPPIETFSAADFQWEIYGTELHLSCTTAEAEPDKFINDFLSIYNTIYTTFEKLPITSVVINLQAINCGVIEWLDAGTITQYGIVMQQESILAQSVTSAQIHRYYGVWTGDVTDYFDSLINTLCN